MFCPSPHPWSKKSLVKHLVKNLATNLRVTFIAGGESYQRFKTHTKSMGIKVNSHSFTHHLLLSLWPVFGIPGCRLRHASRSLLWSSSEIFLGLGLLSKILGALAECIVNFFGCLWRPSGYSAQFLECISWEPWHSGTFKFVQELLLGACREL